MAPRVSLRAMSATSARRADIITDLYVKEVKAFKAPTLTAADAAGSVKEWSAPAAPAAPAVEGDVAAELSEYESSGVEVESAKPAAEGAADAVAEDWFVIEEANDIHH